VLIAAVVQQYIPEHEVVDLDPKELADMNQRVSRILSRKLHEEVMPYAFECSSSALDYRSLGRWVRHAGDRAGLLCCGSVRASLNALRKSSGRLETSDEPRAQVEALRGVVEAEDLLRFVPSEDHYKLRDLV